MSARRPAVLVTSAFLLAAANAPAEVIWLRNGDRVTGTILSETDRALRLKTPFGPLLIPKSRIERLVRADGKEEVLHVPDPVASPTPVTVAVTPRARLVLVVTGATFWQAWDRRDAPSDPTLRLEVRLDEEPVASWTDGQLDPQDMPGAIVNTFAFAPEAAAGFAAPEVQLAPPEVQHGRVVLRIDVPAAAAGAHRLRLAYQANAGAAASPDWHDLLSASTEVTLRTEAPTVIEARQARGGMEFARHRMRSVETFHLELAPE